MALKVPYAGFSEFTLWREPGDDLVEVHVTIDGDTQSYVLDQHQLYTWLRLAGVDPVMNEKIVDVVWNFPRVRYDLVEQRLVVPKDQTHPDAGRFAAQACPFDFAHRVGD